MRQRFQASSPRIGLAVLASATLLLAGCSSREQRAQSYYEHGKQLVAAHEYSRAEIEFRNAISYNKKLVPAWQSLADVEELQHKYRAMLPVLHNILELDPGDMTDRLKLGRLLLAGGAVDDALKLVNDVKEPDSQNAELLALKAAILFKLKDFDGALSEAQAALKIDPANKSAMLVIAANDVAHGDTKAALDVLNSELNSETTSQKVDVAVELFKLQILEKSQDLKSAEALLQKLIALNPKDVSFKKELIRLYLFQHRNDDAEKEQRAVVAMEPGNAEAQLDLVRLLNTTKGAAAAEQELVTLINAGGNVFPYQIALAQLDFNQGKFSDGADILKKLISDASAPDHVLTAQINLAEMYLSQKQSDAAASIVSDILKKDARNANGLTLRAAIEMNHGQLEAAINDLRQALNDKPRATNLMLMLATAYERSGSIDLAAKEFADAMRASNLDPAVSLNYVAFLQRRGRMLDAEDVLTDLAGRWPENVQILSALAQIKMARQEWISAEEVAEKIKSISKNHTLADELLGVALAGGEKYNESIVALQRAYQSEPDATQPLYALVMTYLRAQKPDQAIALLQSVIKANPSNAQAYILLGRVQLFIKKPDQARQSLMTAIEKQPKEDIGYVALADFYIAQNNNDEALKTVRAGLAQQPDSFALQLTLASVLELSGSYEDAISQYENLLKKDPGSMVVANNLASLLADHRTDKASLDQAQTVAASLTNSPLPQFKDTLGWIDYREADYKSAIPLLEAAAQGMPNLALVHYHLGMSYLAVGEADKATEQFKLALAQSPNHELEQKIREADAKSSTKQQ
jgi:tetratricopeptide (TPR) repeat protein